MSNDKEYVITMPRERHHMPRRLAALLLVAFACVAAAMSGVTGATTVRARAGAVTTVGTYRNPVFARDFPDPNVLKVGADYYAYATTTGWEPTGHHFPILHSRDLAHWNYVADAFASAPAWGVGDWWAPDVIAYKGVYYMYYVGKNQAGTHCVAVATAARPVGPFTPRRVIGCGDAKGIGYIDPAPLVAADGKAYLYVSVDNPFDSPYPDISVLPLAGDLMRQSKPRKALFSVSQAWEHSNVGTTVEGPFMVKHGATYDLFYSGNSWQHDYAMGYATSSSPMGPFTKCRCNPILHEVKGVTGPGGGSVIRGPHGGWWLAYHGWTGGPGYDFGGVRNLRIDPLTWTGATVSVRGPTTASEPLP